MYKNKTIGVLIPARGGSTRIINKNIKHVGGTPLIKYTLDHAYESNLADGIYISTNDKNIEFYCRKLTHNVIRRPNSLCGPDSPTEAAILHAIEKGLNYYDYIMMLQPTSPIRSKGRLDEAIELLIDGSYSSLVSVSDKFALTWETMDGVGYPNYQPLSRPRSQDCKIMVENGSIYGFKTLDFIEKQCRIIQPTVLFKMNNPGEDIDIDEPVDIMTAEAIINGFNYKQSKDS